MLIIVTVLSYIVDAIGYKEGLSLILNDSRGELRGRADILMSSRVEFLDIQGSPLRIAEPLDILTTTAVCRFIDISHAKCKSPVLILP